MLAFFICLVIIGHLGLSWFVFGYSCIIFDLNSILMRFLCQGKYYLVALMIFWYFSFVHSIQFLYLFKINVGRRILWYFDFLILHNFHLLCPLFLTSAVKQLKKQLKQRPEGDSQPLTHFCQVIQGAFLLLYVRLRRRKMQNICRKCLSWKRFLAFSVKLSSNNCCLMIWK